MNFQLDSGRTIRLCELRQWYVYEGLLEGVPATKTNRMKRDSIVAQSRRQFYGEPFLIAPTEKPIELNRPPEWGPYPFGEPAEMPPVVCVGRFHSQSPARDKKSHGSGLIVIWFQEDFAFPIDPNVLSELKAINWDELAADWEYADREY